MGALYNNNFSLKERERVNVTELKFDFLNVSTVFFIEIEQSNVGLVKFRVISRIDVNDSSDQADNILDWESEFIKAIYIQLLLHYVLDDFKMFI
jgi:hypothetical protein